jgi:hypothetical protein
MAYTWKYYDLLLFGVMGSLLTGVGVGFFTRVPMSASVPVLALVAVALIGHGLFVNGPVDEIDDLAEEVETLN